ncbi:MAG: single-stranded DNA-binding protein, partial [Patescibacteria group bacterium]
MAARSENMVILIGNLTRDTELRYTEQGNALVSFGMATNREWTSSDGERHEDTQFHEIIAWNRLAEICDEFLRKTSKVYIKGRLQTRTWEDENSEKHYRTEIVTEDMIILDEGKEEEVEKEAEEVEKEAEEVEKETEEVEKEVEEVEKEAEEVEKETEEVEKEVEE